MAVAYEELGGSPRIVFGLQGTTATRILRIAWNDYPALIDELYGSVYGGNPGVTLAKFPGNSSLLVDTVEIEAMDPDNPKENGSGGNTYPEAGAKVTISYKTQEANSGGGGDPDAFFSQRSTTGAEYIKLPGSALYWQGGEQDGQPIGDDNDGGRLVPVIEHNFTYRFVQNVPWAAIRECVGKVNDSNFFGAPAGTLLFVGADTSRDVGFASNDLWTVELHFKERPINWNYFLNPASGKFQMAVFHVNKEEGVYPTADFTSMFG